MNEFRPNAAAILQRPDGKILVCERVSPEGAWQFPQGGVDEGESAREAAIREVEEEVGIKDNEYEIVREEGGYSYDFPPGSKKRKNFRGQTQTYFLCQLRRNGVEVDIDQKPREFRDYRWIRPEEFDIAWVPDFKREVYERVMADFFSLNLSKNA